MLQALSLRWTDIVGKIFGWDEGLAGAESVREGTDGGVRLLFDFTFIVCTHSIMDQLHFEPLGSDVVSVWYV